jgi:hypothetical protein
MIDIILVQRKTFPPQDQNVFRKELQRVGLCPDLCGLRRPQRVDLGGLDRAPPLEAGSRGHRGRNSREDVSTKTALQQTRLQPRHLQRGSRQR